MDISYKALIDTLSQIFSYICIIEVGLSVILNPLVIFICLKSKRLRSISTFKLLVVSAFNDVLVCIPWNIQSFTATIFNYYPTYNSLFYCRWLSAFLQNTTFNIESWLLLSISVDRLLSMVVKKWRRIYFSGYRPYFYSIFLCLFMIGINFHEVFTTGYLYYNNGTELVACNSTNPAYSFDWFAFRVQVIIASF